MRRELWDACQWFAARAPLGSAQLFLFLRLGAEFPTYVSVTAQRVRPCDIVPAPARGARFFFFRLCFSSLLLPPSFPPYLWSCEFFSFVDCRPPRTDCLIWYVSNSSSSQFFYSSFSCVPLVPPVFFALRAPKMLPLSSPNPPPQTRHVPPRRLIATLFGLFFLSSNCAIFAGTLFCQRSVHLAHSFCPPELRTPTIPIVRPPPMS